MLRSFFISAALLTVSAPAFAHPDPDSPQTTTHAPITAPQLPSQADIAAAIEHMPDMNAIMGDMMGLMKDEGFRDKMESSAKAFAKNIDIDDAFKTGSDDLPDFNKAFASMLGAFSDEDAIGGLLNVMTDMAHTMEKHIPEDAKKATKPTP